MDPIYHSADLTVDEMVLDCEGFESGASVTLTKLQAAKVTIPVGAPEQKYNRAIYVSKPDLDPIQKLFFKAVKTAEDEVQARSDALAGGFTKSLFDSQVYVKGSAVRVLGFAKP